MRRRRRKPLTNHIYMGRFAATNAPNFLPTSTLLRHMAIFGGPGSGKSVKQANLIRQLARTGQVSILVFDLKDDDLYQFNTLRVEVEHLRQRQTQGDAPKWKYPFYHVTMRPGASSYLINPFASSEWTFLPPSNQAQMVMAACAVSFSRAYGESWFTDTGRAILEFMFTEARDTGQVPSSFADINAALTPLMKPNDKRLPAELKQAGGHVAYIIDRLAKVEALNPLGYPPAVLENAIDLVRFVQEPSFCVFSLNSFLNPDAAGEVTRVIIFTLLSLSALTDRGIPVIIFIDEFAQAVAGNLPQIFRQARSANVGLILATQSVSDLKQGTIDLTDVIMSSTKVQCFMHVADPAGTALLTKLSGNHLEHFVSISYSPDATYGRPRPRYSVSQSLIDRVNHRELELVSTDKHLEFMRITENVGYAQTNGSLFVNRWDYDVSEAEYRRRCDRATWPTPSAETIVVGDSGPLIPRPGPGGGFIDIALPPPPGGGRDLRPAS